MMKSYIFRCTAVLTVIGLLLCAAGCQSERDLIVETIPPEIDTSVTEPIAAPVDPVPMTVKELMLMDMQNVSELTPFLGTMIEENRTVYMVQNVTDARQFKLEVYADPATGDIIEATLSYGDTVATVVGPNGTVTGAVSEMLRLDPVDMPVMTTENLLVLDPENVTELNNYAFIAEGLTRTYTVQNPASGKSCVLTVTLDKSGAVAAAELSYGETKANMIDNAMVAILDIMTAMEEQ